MRGISNLMTNTAVPPRQSSLLLGIFFMCAACTLFPIMNGIVQVLSRIYPSEQIIWARTTGHLLIVLALIVPRYGVTVLQSRKPGIQISRSLLLLASTTTRTADQIAHASTCTVSIPAEITTEPMMVSP